MSESVDRVDGSLRTQCPRICFSCDYNLVGLPGRSVCPECGTMHPAGLMTISGWTRPPMITWGRGQATRAAQTALLFYVLMIALGECFSLFKRQYGDLPLGGLVIFVGVAVVLGMNIRLAAGRPPMRLRVSASGYELRRGSGPLKLRPWQAAYPAEFRVLGNGCWQVSIGWKDPVRVGSNALQLYWRGDAVLVEELRRVIDSSTQPLKTELPLVYPLIP